MNASEQRRLTPILAALAVLLAAVLLLLLSGIGRGAHWSPPRTLAALPPAGNPANLPRALPLQQFALVWQKPLFNPDRKPIAHAVDGGSSLGDLELTGIILTPGLRMALLHDKNGDTQVRLREGESLPDGSVKLVEIRPRSALFDSSAGRTELKLPAGAPIDDARDAAANTDPRNPAAGPLMRVEPGRDEGGKPGSRSGDGHATIMPARTPRQPPVQQAPDDRSRASFIDRLRENTRKRRAARAAAGHQGVR